MSNQLRQWLDEGCRQLVLGACRRSKPRENDEDSLWMRVKAGLNNMAKSGSRSIVGNFAQRFVTHDPTTDVGASSAIVLGETWRAKMKFASLGMRLKVLRVCGSISGCYRCRLILVTELHSGDRKDALLVQITKFNLALFASQKNRRKKKASIFRMVYSTTFQNWKHTHYTGPSCH